ncbi:WD40 repeat domain-containing protein [Actinoplanes sp. NPDC049548]|uniref:WD40 repeat domain-containing protein n=1 Tax=Actinoplanes sp. NPDC049548 TaxID=3155152 RepID=UPI003425407E
MPINRNGMWPEVRPSTGGRTYSILFSPDGRHLISHLAGDRVRVWDLTTRTPLFEWTDTHDPVFGPEPSTVVDLEVDYLGNGVLLCTDLRTGLTQSRKWPYEDGWPLSGVDGRLEFLVTTAEGEKAIVDAGTGAIRCVLSGATDDVGRGVPSPDGRLLAAPSWKTRRQPIPIWSTTDGVQRAVVPSGGWISSVVFLPGGARCLITGDDTTKVWDFATEAVVLEIDGDEVAVSPDGNRVAVTGDDAAVVIYSTATWEPLVTLEDAGSVNTMAFSPDGTYLATGHTDDSVIRMWDSWSGRFDHDLSGVTREVHALAFSADGRRLTTVTDDEVRIWEIAGERPAYRLPASDCAVNTVAYSPGGGVLAVADDETVRFFDATTASPAGALEPTGSPVLALAFAPGGGMLATACEDGTVHLWGAGREHVGVLDGHGRPAWYAAFHLDGRHLVVADDETVCLWDTTTGQFVLHLAEPGNRVDAVALAPDGRGYAIGTDRSDSLAVYRAAGTEPATPFSDTVSCMAYSPDGALAVGSEENTVHILKDPGSGDWNGFLNGHAGQVRSLAYSPDGRLLAVGCDNGTVHLWDAASERRLAMLIALDDGGSAIVRDSGQRLVDGSPNGELRFWDGGAAATSPAGTW